MTSSRIYGDWRNTLPRYLRKQYPNPATLTDIESVSQQENGVN